MSRDIQKLGQTLHNSPLTTIRTCAREVIKEVTEKTDELDKLSKEIKDTESLLGYFNSKIPGLSEISFIRLVNDLTMPGK